MISNQILQNTIEGMKKIGEEKGLPDVPDEVMEEAVRDLYEDRSTFPERFIKNSKAFLIGVVVIMVLFFIAGKEKQDGMFNYKEEEG